MTSVTLVPQFSLLSLFALTSLRHTLQVCYNVWSNNATEQFHAIVFFPASLLEGTRRGRGRNNDLVLSLMSADQAIRSHDDIPTFLWPAVGVGSLVLTFVGVVVV